MFLFTCELHYGLGIFLLFDAEPVLDRSYTYLTAPAKCFIVILLRLEGGGSLPDVFVLPGEGYFNVLTADLAGQMDLVLPLLELHRALGVEATQTGELPLGERNIGDLHISQVAGPARIIMIRLCCVLSLSHLSRLQRLNFWMSSWKACSGETTFLL